MCMTSYALWGKQRKKCPIGDCQGVLVLFFFCLGNFFSPRNVMLSLKDVFMLVSPPQLLGMESSESPLLASFIQWSSKYTALFFCFTWFYLLSLFFHDSIGENADRDREKKSLERVNRLCFLLLKLSTLSCGRHFLHLPLFPELNCSHLGHT